MTSQEIAMKFSSASASCKRDKCPYHKECGGYGDQCKLKDVALILREQDLQIETLQAKVNELYEMIQTLQRYEAEVETVNKRYAEMVNAYKCGKKPQYRTIRGGKRVKIRKPRKKKDPKEMDGDERYAMETPPVPAPPLVVV